MREEAETVQAESQPDGAERGLAQPRALHLLLSVGFEKRVRLTPFLPPPPPTPRPPLTPTEHRMINVLHDDHRHDDKGPDGRRATTRSGQMFFHGFNI